MMRVQTVAEHNDHDGKRRVVGEPSYETDEHRAAELQFAGFVEPLDWVDRVNWLREEGRILSPLPTPSSYAPHPIDPVAPRVIQLTQYDPGNAAYRYHSAANSQPGGVSAFVRYYETNPYCDLRQYDGDKERIGVSHLFDSADVVHVHMDYATLDENVHRWPDRNRQLLVRHYHGSDGSGAAQPAFMQNQLDADLGALQLGARLYHNRYSSAVQWLPIPMPVADYSSLPAAEWIPIEQRTNRCVRVAHSPTHAAIKGTIVLETVVQDLQLLGLPIELVMIAGKSHAEALRLKASCDITFDSFWLGIQGSGLEAACMGQVVVAGDVDVKAEYEREVGYCPYTFAKGYDELREQLEKLVLDPAFRYAEASRVGGYVRAYHDYPAVGARYWKIVNAALAARGLHATAA